MKILIEKFAAKFEKSKDLSNMLEVKEGIC